MARLEVLVPTLPTRDRELLALKYGAGANAAVPSAAMVAWAIGFVFVALAIALRQFQKRAL